MNRSLRSNRLKLGLRAESGLAVGQFFPLTATRNIIGRSVDAVVAVDDGKASRHHAAVDLQNGFYVLVDLGSTNGTFLNGKRLEKGRFLNPGDKIRIGSSTFAVELAEKARHQAARNWREPTNVQLPAPGLQNLTPAQPRKRESTGPRLGWDFVRRALPGLELDSSSPAGRWLVIGFSLLLVLGAILVRG